MRALMSIACATVALFMAGPTEAAGLQGDPLQGVKWTVWLGSALVLHGQPPETKAFSFGVGLGAVRRAESSGSHHSTSYQLQPVIEGFYYPSREGHGLAGGVRLGLGTPTYLAPGAFYVSGPKGQISGRVGLMAVVAGSDQLAESVIGEIAIGFSF